MYMLSNYSEGQAKTPQAPQGTINLARECAKGTVFRNRLHVPAHMRGLALMSSFSEHPVEIVL